MLFPCCGTFHFGPWLARFSMFLLHSAVSTFQLPFFVHFGWKVVECHGFAALPWEIVAFCIVDSSATFDITDVRNVPEKASG